MRHLRVLGKSFVAFNTSVMDSFFKKDAVRTYADPNHNPGTISHARLITEECTCIHFAADTEALTLMITGTKLLLTSKKQSRKISIVGIMCVITSVAIGQKCLVIYSFFSQI